jgi:hypothetical protein
MINNTSIFRVDHMPWVTGWADRREGVRLRLKK